MPTEKRKIKNDVILIASLTLAFALIGACLLLLGKQGDTVTVTVDGKVYGEYALARDTEVEILSDGGYNLLVIRGIGGGSLLDDTVDIIVRYVVSFGFGDRIFQFRVGGRIRTAAFFDGVYPCGEGAGYAGGIMSAACDGIAVANKIAKKQV